MLSQTQNLFNIRLDICFDMGIFIVFNPFCACLLELPSQKNTAIEIVQPIAI